VCIRNRNVLESRERERLVQRLLGERPDVCVFRIENALVGVHPARREDGDPPAHAQHLAHARQHGRRRAKVLDHRLAEDGVESLRLERERLRLEIDGLDAEALRELRRAGVDVDARDLESEPLERRQVITASCSEVEQAARSLVHVVEEPPRQQVGVRRLRRAVVRVLEVHVARPGEERPLVVACHLPIVAGLLRESTA
jgi:hypothetical protein